MSYEGYTQFLCSRNHYWTEDCYSYGINEKCPKCGDKIVWENGVDVTNGSHEGNKRIDGYVKLKLKKEHKCDKCNSVLEQTYHIPKSRGHKLV